MHKQTSLFRVIVFCVLALAFNLVSAFVLGDVLHIPLFMDTIGTVFIVFYAGLVPGLVVGIGYNILRFFLMALLGNPVYPWEMMYCLCDGAIAFFTWLIYRKNQYFYYSRPLVFLYLVLIALVTAFASSIIGGAIETTQRILFHNHIYVNPVRNFVTAFLGQNFGLFVSCTFSRIPITVLDRIICTFLGAGIYQLVRNCEKKMAERAEERNESFQ